MSVDSQIEKKPLVQEKYKYEFIQEIGTSATVIKEEKNKNSNKNQ